MPYDAVTIDADIFIRDGINLETGLLAQLSQFKQGPLDLVLSEITTREVLKHLTYSTKKAKDAVIGTARRASDLHLVGGDNPEALGSLLAGLGDPKAVASQRLTRFIDVTGAEIIPAKLASMDDLVRTYFAPSPPFEAAGDKKSEFPDAIALLSLEKWAETAGKKVLAVSGDKGWAEFAEGSAQIDVETDLAKALEIVQEHTDSAEETVSALLRAVEEGAAPDQAADMRRMLSSSLSEWEYHPEGSGSFHLEADAAELRLQEYTVIKHDGDYETTIVRIGSDTIVARIGAEFHVDAYAEFSLSTWDSIDREYIGMGGAVVEHSTDFEGAFLLTLRGDLSGAPEELSVDGVEIVEAINSFDFGEIEFDYGDYDEDDYQAWAAERDAEERGPAEAVGLEVGGEEGPVPF